MLLLRFIIFFCFSLVFQISFGQKEEAKYLNYYFKFKNEYQLFSAEKLEGNLRSLNAKVEDPFLTNDVSLNRIFEIKLSAPKTLEEVLDFCREIEGFEYVETVPDHEFFYTPNDYATQQYNLDKIAAKLAWDINKGDTGIVVAVVDDAVQLNHPDLNDNIWRNWGEVANNGIDDDGNGYIDDINGWDAADNDNDASPVAAANANYHAHGTHCAGIVSAETDNNSGIASIGFKVKMMPVKIGHEYFNSFLGRNVIGLRNAFRGVDYAIAAGANVISMSWGRGRGGASQTEQLIFNVAYSRNIICVAAAGNNNTNVNSFFPASYSHVISVASSTGTDAKSGFSNYGSKIDVTAPGSSIYSTVPGSSYATKSGTSMACPLVSGLCGLMLSQNPTLSVDDVESCLKSSCDTIDIQNPNYIGQLGAGRINAQKALQCLKVISANFNYSSVCPKDTVSFTDMSAPQPTSWSWSFAGGTPSISSLQNPRVVFSTPGSYSIKLVVTNSKGSDSITKDINIATPSAKLSGSQTILKGQTTFLRLDFSGQPPFKTQISNGIDTMTINTQAKVYYEPVQIDTTSVFKIISFSDLYCDGTFADSALIEIDGECSTSSFQIAIGGSQNEAAYDFINLQDSTFIVVGITSSTGRGGNDGFLVRLDENGGVIWQKTFGTSGSDWIYSIQLLDSQHFVTSGLINGKAAVTKWKIDGTVVWQKRLNSSLYSCMYETLPFYGNSLISLGYTRSSAGNNASTDIIFMKLDSNGNTVWSKSISHPQFHNSKNFTVTPDSGFVIATNFLNGGSYDHWLIKFDKNGNLDWSKQAGTSNNENIICVTSDENYLYFGDNYRPTSSNLECFLAKMDFDGNLVWAKRYGGSKNDRLRSIHLGDDGLIYTTNSAESTAYGSYDFLNVVFDTSGNLVYANNVGGSGFEFSYMSKKDKTSGVFSVGVTQSFGSGADDMYLVKTDCDNQTTCNWKDVSLTIHPVSIVYSNKAVSLVNSSSLINSSGITDTANLSVNKLCFKSTKVPDCFKTDSTYDISNGLVAYYNFEGNGLNQVNNHSHLSPVNSVSFENSKCSNLGKAFRGNGLGYLQGNMDSLELDVYTYSFWAKLNQKPNTGSLYLAVDVGGSGGDQLVQVNNRITSTLQPFNLIGWYGGGYFNASNYVNRIQDSVPPDTGKWYHIVYMKTTDSIKLYVDCQKVASRYEPLDPYYGSLSTRKVTVGARFNGTFRIKGLIDEVRIHNRALTEKEIECLCNCSVNLNNACVSIDSVFKISNTEGSFSPTLSANSGFGYRSICPGDIDNDGVLDLVVGAPTSGSAKGKVYVLLMNADNSVKSEVEISENNNGFNTTLFNDELLGNGLSPLGDFNNDGIPDIVIGSRSSDGATHAGAIYVCFLDTNGTVKSHEKISKSTGGISSSLISGGSNFGVAIDTIGDMDGDGYMDLIVGGHNDPTGGSNTGAAWIVYLKSDGTCKSATKLDKNTSILGPLLDVGGRFGLATAGLPDIDGDGVRDIAISSYTNSIGGTSMGALYVLRMNANGTVKAVAKNTAIKNANFINTNNYSFGIDAEYLGVDGLTGRPILGLGCFRDDAQGNDRGAIVLANLDSAGKIISWKKYSTAKINDDYTINNDDLFGSSIALMENGNGEIKLAVGAMGDDDGGSMAGAVYIITIADTCIVECDINASFVADASCQNIPVEFTNSTTSADTQIFWKYLFGDGDSVVGVPNPNHHYSDTGCYDVTLIVGSSGENGVCLDTITQQVCINEYFQVSLDKERDTICLNDTAIFSLTSICSDSSLTYKWSPNVNVLSDSQSTLRTWVNKDEMYTVMVQDSQGNTWTDTVFLVVDSTCAKSMVMFEPEEFAYCVGDTLKINNQSRPVGPANYDWYVNGNLNNTGDTFTPFVLNTAGDKVILLVMEDVNGLDSLMQDIVVYDLPEVDLVSDTQICFPDTITLGSSNLANKLYQWSPTANVFNPQEGISEVDVNGETTLSLGVFDMFTGCSNMDSIRIKEKSAINFSLGADTSICENEPLSIGASIGGSYRWNTGEITGFINPIITGEYILSVKQGKCESLDTIQIQIDTLVNFSLGVDASLCSDSSLLLDPISYPSSFGYLWNDNSTSPQKMITTGGVYSLTLTNGKCATSDTIDINEVSMPNPFNLGNDTTICETDSIRLGFNFAGTYLWNNGSTDSEIYTNNSGSYMVTYNKQGCIISDTIVINHDNVPQFSLGQDLQLCSDTTLELSPRSFNPAYEYLWSTGETDSVITVTSEGIYSLQITNGKCQALSSITISEVPVPEMIDLGLDTILCIGDTFSIGVPFNPDFRYLWNVGSQNSRIIIEDSGLYRLRVYNECGAQLDEIKIEIEDCSCVLYVPSAFTPNGDVLNDEFLSSYCELESFKLEIFTRWGEKIFETEDINKGWDGTVKGKSVSGTYFWLITAESQYKNQGRPYMKTGAVQVIR